MSLNRAILIGRVGKDPEIRTMTNGDKIASFSLATSESWKDKASGERKEKTEWHNIVCFNDNLTKIIEAHVNKGDQLCVEGSIQTRKWTDKDGKERYSTEIVIQRFTGGVTLLGGSKSVGEGSAAPVAGKQGRETAAFDLDDEIPF